MKKNYKDILNNHKIMREKQNDTFTEFCLKLNKNVVDCKSRSNKISDILSEDEHNTETIKVCLDIFIGGYLFEDFIPNYTKCGIDNEVGKSTYKIGYYILDDYINVELYIDIFKRTDIHNYDIINENGITSTFDIINEELRSM